MKATIKINMDNAAFEDSGELGRILREVADKLDRCELRYRASAPFVLCDINGNKVGELKVAK